MAALGSNMKGRNKPEPAEPEAKQTPKKGPAKKTAVKRAVAAAKAKPAKKEPAKKKAPKKSPPKTTVSKSRKIAAKASPATKAVKEKSTPVPKVSVEKEPVEATKAVAKEAVKPPVAPAEAKPQVKTPKVLIDLKGADLILEPSKRKKIKKTRVFLEGELTINNVEGFIQRIHPIFESYDYVDFYLRKVTSLDLCFVQMLYHMQQSYGKKQKNVTIDSELSSDLKKIIVHAGFEELMFIPKLV